LNESEAESRQRGELWDCKSHNVTIDQSHNPDRTDDIDQTLTSCGDPFPPSYAARDESVHRNNQK
jgi:hypothetical protein